MSFKVTTLTATEQQFEADIRAATLRVFPWLPASGISHQTTFSFTFGHATITVDGLPKTSAHARADVLVSLRGSPLAMLELKRPGSGLTAEDEKQGLSYARVIYPSPPLVVVTDGTDTRILETHTGKPWKPATPSEETLERLFANSAAGAAANLKAAIGQLMGSDPDIWMQAVRETTRKAIAERSSDWNDRLSPFVEGFLLPRRVAKVSEVLLAHRQRLVMIEGAPLSGKSNALREVAALTATRTDLAVLYLDADAGLNLYESLASVLSDALEWPITADEARYWVRNLSRADGPALVLAIDNMGADCHDLRKDIEAVTSNQFGQGLLVLLAVDDAVASRLTKTRNGRGCRRRCRPASSRRAAWFGVMAPAVGRRREGR